jgi:hypothetical protein
VKYDFSDLQIIQTHGNKWGFHDLAAALVFIWFRFSINNIDARGWRYTFFVHHTAICECRVTTSIIREICIDISDRATSMLSLPNCKHHPWATLRSSPSSVSQILRQSKIFLIQNHTKTCKWPDCRVGHSRTRFYISWQILRTWVLKNFFRIKFFGRPPPPPPVAKKISVRVPF